MSNGTIDPALRIANLAFIYTQFIMLSQTASTLYKSVKLHALVSVLSSISKRNTTESCRKFKNVTWVPPNTEKNSQVTG